MPAAFYESVPDVVPVESAWRSRFCLPNYLAFEGVENNLG